MKKLFLMSLSIMIGFALLLPFTSKTSDGLQNIIDNYEKQQQPVWNGLMADYNTALGNPYISTLIAGLIGIGIVLAASFAVGATLMQKKKPVLAKK